MALGVRTFVGWVAGVWRSARERIGLGRDPHLRDAPAADEVTDDLPSACLRGIRVPKWVEGNAVLFEAFIPDSNTSASREDKGEETSVNWEDDGDVLARTQREQNAQHGVARVLKENIEYVRTRRQTLDMLFGERREIEGNRHHGNIVFKAGLTKALKKAAANALAIDAEYVSKPKKGS